MKQFNLMEHLANPSRKIVTRDGRNVRIICTDKKGTKFPIVALVECEDKEETCYYTPKGYWNSFEEESDIDLFFAPKKAEGWANIFNVDGCNHLDHKIYESKEDAEKEGKRWSFYVATIKIEWEEEQA